MITNDPNARFGRTPSQVRRRWWRDGRRRAGLGGSDPAAAGRWRGCLGLAVLLDRPDDTFYSGDLALVRNDQLTWIGVVDAAAGGPDRRADRDGRRRGTAPSAAVVARVVSDAARLRHGLPVVTFAGGDHGPAPISFELSRPPIRRGAESDDDGGPTVERDVRWRTRSAAVVVSADMTRFADAARAAGRHRTLKPGRWCPRPYLAFGPDQRATLVREIAGGARRPGSAACAELRRGLGQGLPLAAIGPETYLGREPQRRGGASAGVVHRLRGEADGAERTVWLPSAAKVLVGAGRQLDAGELWARGLPSGLPATAETPPDELVRAWAEHRLARLAAVPEQLLVASDLVAPAVTGGRVARPLALWWDTAAAVQGGWYGWEVQAAAFPPIPLARRDALRLELPCGLWIDATAVTATRRGRSTGVGSGVITSSFAA